MINKTIIFISHATPEDNYFAVWLAAKLKVLGYEAWVDLDDLRAGDSFYTVIQPKIEREAAKFVAVNTRDYIRKSQDQHSGVSRELNCAVTVKDVSNFIIPIRSDNIDYNDFPMHYKGWDAIDFFGNWQAGLIDLVAELSKAEIPKKENPDDPLSLWFDSIKAQNTVLLRREFYYSNWFEIHLPSKVYVHQPDIFHREDTYNLPYPFTLEANRIITFAGRQTIEGLIPLCRSDEIGIAHFIADEDLLVSEELTIKEPRKKLIRLLNNTFEHHLRGKNLVCWVKGDKGNRKRLFYFRHAEHNGFIRLSRYGWRSSRRQLTGQTTECIDGHRQKVNWHFAISASASIDPKPHYKIFYTVVFSDKNYMRFDKSLQHQLRRKVPSEWYNRKWFETLLAAMMSISASPDDNELVISIDTDGFLRVANEPFKSTSEIGYLEPKNVQ